jgi:hypothetical protein
MQDAFNDFHIAELWFQLAKAVRPPAPEVGHKHARSTAVSHFR